MSRALALSAGRTLAEAGMVDACTIRRPSGAGTTDPITGYPTQAYTVLYTGKCRVQQTVAIARPHDVGENLMYVVRFDLQLPVVGSEGLQVDDQVTVTASVNDADLVDRVFLISVLFHKSEATARRLGIVERTAV